MQTLSKFASKLIKTCYLLDKITLFVQLLACLFDGNCNRNGHTNHGVVTCADETHHLYVSRNGGRTCELSVGVHSTHSVSHTVGSEACCHDS